MDFHASLPPQVEGHLLTTKRWLGLLRRVPEWNGTSLDSWFPAEKDLQREG